MSRLHKNLGSLVISDAVAQIERKTFWETPLPTYTVSQDGALPLKCPFDTLSYVREHPRMPFTCPSHVEAHRRSYQRRRSDEPTILSLGLGTDGLFGLAADRETLGEPLSLLRPVQDPGDPVQFPNVPSWTCVYKN
jgi:hypothetical protein